MKPAEIKTLFLDIGGVLLTDGWSREARMAAASNFHLDQDEMETRHRQAFDTYELGKSSLKDYLDWVVFFEERAFTLAEFREFMFAQSKPLPGMIDYIRALKAKRGLKVIVVSNEARDLNDHRIRTFDLAEFVDCFISSCFVHLRKPDADIFKLALDVAQTPPAQIAYLENTAMFVQIAEGMGIHGVVHTDLASTREKMGLLCGGGVRLLSEGAL